MTDDNYGCLPGPNNFRRIAEAMEQPKQFINETWHGNVPPNPAPAINQPRVPGLNCPDRDWCAGNGCWWDCTRPFDSEEP